MDFWVGHEQQIPQNPTPELSNPDKKTKKEPCAWFLLRRRETELATTPDSMQKQHRWIRKKRENMQYILQKHVVGTQFDPKQKYSQKSYKNAPLHDAKGAQIPTKPPTRAPQTPSKASVTWCYGT